MDIFADPGRHLLHCFCIVWTAGDRSDRRARNHATRALPGRSVPKLWPARLSHDADRFLVRARGSRIASDVRGGRRNLARVNARLLRTRFARVRLRFVSVAMHRGPGVHVVSMGLPFARGRISGYLFGQLETRRVLVSMAAVPPDISLRRGEADEPRSNLAQSDRHELSLLDPAAADSGGLVRESAAVLVPSLFDRDGFRHRIGGSVPILCASPVAVFCRILLTVSAEPDFPHRELHLLQRQLALHAMHPQHVLFSPSFRFQ